MNRWLLSGLVFALALSTEGCIPLLPRLLGPASTPTLIPTVTRVPASPTANRTPTPIVTVTSTARTATPAVRTATPGAAIGTATRTATPARGTAVPSTPTTPPNTSNLNLRQVNWKQVVTNEPGLNHPSEQPPSFMQGDVVFVEPKEPGANAGWAAVSSVVYGDISGDGREEALIPIDSGGTAGTVGYLIYSAGQQQPILATVLTGYKVFAKPDNGQLLVSEPIYAGWEGNCCPSGESETRYRLTGATLVQMSRNEKGIREAMAPTVERFYAYLNEKQFRDAYAFLSPQFQAANPFDRWVAGYANTGAIEAAANEVPGQNAVTINLTVSERTQSGQTTRRYSGRWSLIWSTAAGQWLLDQAQITEAR